MSHEAPIPKRHPVRFDPFVAHVAAWIEHLGERLSADVHEAERFLRLLDPDADAFAFRCFSQTPYTRRPGGDPLEQECIVPLREAWPRIIRLNRQGAGIAVAINAIEGRRRTAANVVRIRTLFADLDRPLETWPDPLPPPHMWIESSPGKAHLYWLVEGIPLDAFLPLQKGICRLLHSDDRVNGLAQAMQLPGLWHRKAPRHPHQVRIRTCLDRPRYTLSELTHHAATPAVDIRVPG